MRAKKISKASHEELKEESNKRTISHEVKLLRLVKRMIVQLKDSPYNCQDHHEAKEIPHLIHRLS